MGLSKKKYCCAALKEHATRKCTGSRGTIHRHRHDCPDVLIMPFERGDFGIIIHDGGASAIIINFCPWCGADIRPPKGKR